MTDQPRPRRCGRARVAAGARPGAADAQLLPRPDQLRPGRVLAVAGGGPSHGLQISFACRDPRALSSLPAVPWADGRSGTALPGKRCWLDQQHTPHRSGHRDRRSRSEWLG